jgi:hypothetical protein
MVLGLFALVYFTPIFGYAAVSSILGGLGNGFLAFIMSLYFPCGLAAAFLSSDGRLSDQEFFRCTVLGYVIYFALIVLGMLARRSWFGVVTVLVLFVVLLGINIGGCKQVAAHEAQKIHAP